MGSITSDQLIDLFAERHNGSPVNASSAWLCEVRRQYSTLDFDPIQAHQAWLRDAPSWFGASSLNQISGLGAFPVIEACMGVNHFIDNLVQQHGIRGIQVLEHDYTYYWRLDPDLVPSQPGNLEPGRPLLISMPFAGYYDTHPRMQEILDECVQKNIPVHVDSAWLTAARDIVFDYDHPAIHSVAMSLSKGMDLWWNRIGIRWSRQPNPQDSITIFNQFKMIPASLMHIGLYHIHRVPPDHLWNLYNQRYNDICKTLYLRPTRFVHVAQSMDRTKLFGLKNLLEQFR